MRTFCVPPRILFAAASLSALFTAPVAAQAAPGDCADYDISFARGTDDLDPPVGRFGVPFSDAVKAKAPGKTFNFYPVDYPASKDPGSAGAGAQALVAHIRAVAAACPDTRFVLSGYSQGAEVVDAVISHEVSLSGFTDSLSPQLTDRIAGIALFGDPNRKDYHGPPPTDDPAVANRVISQCANHDPVCQPDGGDIKNHFTYVTDGQVDAAADFVVRQLDAG